MLPNKIQQNWQTPPSNTGFDDGATNYQGGYGNPSNPVNMQVRQNDPNGLRAGTMTGASSGLRNTSGITGMQQATLTQQQPIQRPTDPNSRDPRDTGVYYSPPPQQTIQPIRPPSDPNSIDPRDTGIYYSRPPQDQNIDLPPQNNASMQSVNSGTGLIPTDGFEETGPYPAGDPRGDYTNVNQHGYAPLPEEVTPPNYAEMQPLEGEFIPSQMAQGDFDLYAPEGNYGLAGAENSLRAGMNAQATELMDGGYSAINSANQGYQNARHDIGQGLGYGLDLLGQGTGQARSDISNYLGSGLSSLRSGISRGKGDIQGQLNSGISSLRQGISAGRGDINSSSQGAIDRFNPYVQTGQSALDVEAARSGALGPEAQAQAYADYLESPAQKWQREQQEKALIRNQAATGGSQSGNVLTALQEQASGRASQNFQQDLMNLRSLSERGQQGSASQANIESQAGRDLAQMEMTGGQSELSARNAAGTAMGNLEGMGAQAALNANVSAGNNMSNLAFNAGSAGANMMMDTGRNFADLARNAGMTEAQYQQAMSRDLSSVYGGAATNIANLRSAAGNNIANQINATGSSIAQLENQLGISLAGLDQNTVNQIANLAAQQGGATSGLRTDLASLLTNLATGNANTQSGLAVQLGNANAGGVTNTGGNTASALTAMIAQNPQMFSSDLPQNNAPSTGSYSNAPSGPQQ